MRLVYYFVVFLLFLFTTYDHATRVTKFGRYDAVKTIGTQKETDVLFVDFSR